MKTIVISGLLVFGALSSIADATGFIVEPGRETRIVTWRPDVSETVGAAQRELIAEVKRVTGVDVTVWGNANTPMAGDFYITTQGGRPATAVLAARVVPQRVFPSQGKYALGPEGLDRRPRPDRAGERGSRGARALPRLLSSACCPKGVRFRFGRPGYAQALHHAWEDLEFARHRKNQQRIYAPAVPRPEVFLNLDCRQCGIGEGSCGERPLDRYLVPAQAERWTIEIEGVFGR